MKTIQLSKKVTHVLVGRLMMMVLTLLHISTPMMAQDYDKTVTFTALNGNPEGNKGFDMSEAVYYNHSFANLFDGKKTSADFSKWCYNFDSNTTGYVVFRASKAGVPVGYTITTGNDNSTLTGRNPKSWKLYGKAQNGVWKLIQKVYNDTKLKDENYTSYDFTCDCSASYQDFKWEILDNQGANVLQVSEFELKLVTCQHENADGSSAVGKFDENGVAVCTACGLKIYKPMAIENTVTLAEGVTAEFATISEYSWERCTGEDKYASQMGIKSGNPNKTNTSSNITFTFTSTDDFILSYGYAVSTDIVDEDDEYFDFSSHMEIKIDGEKLAAINKETNGTFNHLLTSGTHVLKATYYQYDTSNKKCDDCGYLFDIKAIKCKHEHLAHQEAIAATCSERGRKDVWYCDDCKIYFKDATAKELYVDEENNETGVWIAKNPTNHAAIGEFDENGIAECAACGNKAYRQPGIETGEDGKEYYLISEYAHLCWFRDYVNTAAKTLGEVRTKRMTANAKLTSNITMLSDWTPISYVGTDYAWGGTFDGCSYTINNMPDMLFGIVMGGTIKNIDFTNVNILDGGDSTGTLAGELGSGSTVSDIRVLSGSVTGQNYVGGITGTCSSNLLRCVNYASVNGSNDSGGITGVTGNAIKITDCANYGTVSCSNNGAGIIGRACYDITLERVFSTGNKYSICGIFEGYIFIKGSVIYSKEIDGATPFTIKSSIANGYAYKMTGLSAAELKTGKAAYLLQNGRNDLVWGQKLGEGNDADKYPVLTADNSKKVYPCCSFGSNPEYRNTDAESTTNGFCDICDASVPAELNADNIYEIGNAGQLAWFATAVNNGLTYHDAKLTADINMDGRTVTPIGVNDDKFYRGIFDGCNHTISNYVVHAKSTNQYNGLFGKLDYDTNKGELIIRNNFSAIRNVKANGTLYLDNNDPNLGSRTLYCSPFVAELVKSKIENCEINCEIKVISPGSYGYVGGVVGFAWDYSIISDCHVKGSITNEGVPNIRLENCGGFAGYAGSNVNVNDCVNDVTADIALANKSANTIQGFGGMFGYLCYNPVIVNCINNADLTIRGIAATDGEAAACQVSYLGGIVGHADNNTIKQCINKGNLTITDTKNGNIGGIVGYINEGRVYVTIENCANFGTLTCGNEKMSPVTEGQVGGILGYYDFRDDQAAFVNNCFNVGRIHTKTGSGSIVSHIGNSGAPTTPLTNYYLPQEGIPAGATHQNMIYISFTEDDAKSGKLCYLLNGRTSEGDVAWYQKLGEGGDAYPVFTAAENKKVYAESIHKYCDNEIISGTYSNTPTEIATVIQHKASALTKATLDTDQHIYHRTCRNEGCTWNKLTADLTGHIEVTKIGDKFVAKEGLTFRDGDEFRDYEAFTAPNVSYTRHMASTWGTLCVPFAITLSKETECDFYSLDYIDEGNECIALTKYNVETIPAGTPVLFKMKKDETMLNLTATDADIVTAPVEMKDNFNDAYLAGTFLWMGDDEEFILDDDCYFISRDKFWRVGDIKDKNEALNGVKVAPMRAFIVPLSPDYARAARLSIGNGDNVTAIDGLNVIADDAEAEYYDVNGRRTNGLHNGMNIVKRGNRTFKIMIK